MANRRGTDGFSSPSVEDKDETNIIFSSAYNAPRQNNLRNRDEPDHSTGPSEASRETKSDLNPFSFKHFLKKDARPNYNLGGARPKVYSPARTIRSEEKVASESEGIYPCNPTELPDFVQDHLVIEQCYLNPEASSVAIPLVADIDNLPDFTINSTERRKTTRGGNNRKDTEKSEIPCDLPFDLTGDLDRRNRDRTNIISSDSSSNVDLSSYPRPNKLPLRQADRTIGTQGFPFDLPSSTTRDSNLPNSIGSTGDSPANDSVVNKSLPDFLNDGPIIRNRVTASETEPSLDVPERADSGLSLENKILREELENNRRDIADKMRIIESLKAELASRRAVDHDETAHLEKAMEQVEVNLKRSTKRATSAESAVTLLKQEVKALTAEISVLRSENRELRSIAGAGCNDYRLPDTENRIKKLSDELRAAATSAEVSLRQLMSGVNNLKLMASALENIDRIEDSTKEFLPDFEEENATGPAL